MDCQEIPIPTSLSSQAMDLWTVDSDFICPRHEHYCCYLARKTQYFWLVECRLDGDNIMKEHTRRQGSMIDWQGIDNVK